MFNKINRENGSIMVIILLKIKLVHAVSIIISKLLRINSNEKSKNELIHIYWWNGELTYGNYYNRYFNIF